MYSFGNKKNYEVKTRDRCNRTLRLGERSNPNPFRFCPMQPKSNLHIKHMLTPYLYTHTLVQRKKFKVRNTKTYKMIKNAKLTKRQKLTKLSSILQKCKMQTLEHTNTHEGARKKCSFQINYNCNKKTLANLLAYLLA